MDTSKANGEEVYCDHFNADGHNHYVRETYPRGLEKLNWLIENKEKIEKLLKANSECCEHCELLEEAWDKYCMQGDGENPDRMFYEMFMDAGRQLLTDQKKRILDDLISYSYGIDTSGDVGDMLTDIVEDYLNDKKLRV